ncbi:MAG: methyltransferase domain-containing protein [Deltaproteobacteria bacterium]|nr:methyltransferase domain-containing protein [Deltaproteobacteria bacterium]
MTLELKIKIDLEAVLAGPGPVEVELGCGARRESFAECGRIGIDRVELDNVDIVADLEQGLSFLPDRSVDVIHARSLFEHIENFELLLGEILRVLKDDGRARILVPHFSNPYHYSDPTHVRFFGLYSFYYFCRPECQPARKVPVFYTAARLRIHSLKLVFKSPFTVRRRIKKLWQKLFNLSPAMQEFYEENLCWILPCYGIRLEFGPDRDPQKAGERDGASRS